MDSVAYLTGSEMREVDRIMIADYRIELIQMMENAGHVLAMLARERFLDGDPTGRNVLVIAGPGNNGGGGLVAARRLFGWGADVQVITTHPPEKLIGVPEHQFDIVQRLEIPCTHAGQPTVLGEYALVIDAILGYGLDGPPRGDVHRMIGLVNELGAPILSLDTPTGLDVTNGTAEGAAIRATATLTLAMPKIGLRAETAAEFVGDLFVGDIGVPPELYSRSGLAYEVGPIFARHPYIEIS